MINLKYLQIRQVKLWLITKVSTNKWIMHFKYIIDIFSVYNYQEDMQKD